MKASNRRLQPKRGPKSREANVKDGANDAEDLLEAARLLAGPRLASALVEEVITKKLVAFDLDFTPILRALNESSDRIKAGDLGDAESMLHSQASSLNLLYAELVRRAFNNLDSHCFEAGKQYLSLAMKAQNQCRMTLETLGNIKNPPAVFARQANINNGGQQQVNNSAVPLAPATENEIQPVKLVEQSDDAPMDTGAAGPAGQKSSQLETVDTFHRPKVA